ncbi:hypothetical protein EZS27_008665 [termite gut metagenome]|uniref:Uncharacterized protein n=1 Tax=termite gut metagenome TaxID=433724 RepID=A0A5J4SE92_9ZZZZ
MDNCNYYYQFNTIKRLWILDKDHVNKITFQDDKRPEIGLIDEFDIENLIELQCDDENTNLTQKNSYDLELSTIITDINYSTTNLLNSLICGKYIVIFLTGEKRYFCFGVDEGASLTYELDINNGYKVTLLENNSYYPVFQIKINNFIF